MKEIWANCTPITILVSSPQLYVVSIIGLQRCNAYLPRSQICQPSPSPVEPGFALSSRMFCVKIFLVIVSQVSLKTPKVGIRICKTVFVKKKKKKVCQMKCASRADTYFTTIVIITGTRRI